MPSELTNRQLDVLIRMAHGESDKQMAATLGISVHTAHFHVLDVARRLGTKTRVQSVVRGLQLGLLQLDALKVTP